ncbi:hypothetical protein GCM10027591_17400 [Zhihengliuella somnathii]
MLTAGLGSSAVAVVDLAERADRSTFAADAVTEQEVADYWAAVEDQSAALSASATFWQRLRAKYSPRSLMHDAAAQAAARRAARGPGERGGWGRLSGLAQRPSGRGRPVRKVNDNPSKE